MRPANEADRPAIGWLPRFGVTAAIVALCSGLVACSSVTGSAGGSRISSQIASTSPSTAAAVTIGDLTLTGGYIPQPASPDVAAAYLTIVNNGATADTMTKVITNVTSDVMAMTETDQGGVGTMTDITQVTIAAHSSYTFTPGHAHLMLQNPKVTLKAGDSVALTISFAHAGTVQIELPVDSITGPTASAGNMSGMHMG
jgi:copper(I)-binding protein